MPLEPDPDWLVATGLPASVVGWMTTRAGGHSSGAFRGLNVRPAGLPGVAHEVDLPADIARNQSRLVASLGGAQPVWLNQVHGTRVLRLGPLEENGDAAIQGWPEADAAITTERGVACTVMAADCLPVLLSAEDGCVVGAAHAGWRGLCAGVLEATVAAMCQASGVLPARVVAWMGACIGPDRFEVGDDVRLAFGPNATQCFLPASAGGKWMADLPTLARLRLGQAGVRQIQGGQWCTASDPSRFFSFRRDRVTGRHAAVIWRA